VADSTRHFYRSRLLPAKSDSSVLRATEPAGLNAAVPVAEPLRAASFRDPGGRVIRSGGRILRFVVPEAVAELRSVLAHPVPRRLVEAGRVVRSRELSIWEAAEYTRDPAFRSIVRNCSDGAIFEHEAIPFPTYPYEWSPEMLHAAGLLTIDMALELLGAGLGLKDATPYNVLFRGPDPVFVDLLSFERRRSDDPTWLPCAQFLRTFLFPLLLDRTGTADIAEIFLARRDGITVLETFGRLSLARKLSPRCLFTVTMPALLSGAAESKHRSLYRSRSVQDPDRAAFVLTALLRSLRRRIVVLEPKGGRKSRWSAYMAETGNNYSAEAMEKKELFVRDFIRQQQPARVLDVGCNTGRFSFIAAEGGSDVVAIDSDPVVAGEVWRAARKRGLRVLPMVQDICRPSAATGWRNTECPSFLERASGAFDAVFFLAVIHHMLVSERVPLDEVIGLAAQLTTTHAIVEFVSPSDSMFQRLARGRDELHSGLTTAVFEDVCAERFRVLEKLPLPGGTRFLYHLRKRQ